MVYMNMYVTVLCLQAILILSASFLCQPYIPLSNSKNFSFTCIIIHVNQQDSGRLSILILFPDPFEVAFVETSYIVFENVGTVKVCVNLTEPQIDILSEEVYVMVFNDPNSVYIPAGGILASKSLYLIRN